MSKLASKKSKNFEIDVPVTEARADLATLIEKTYEHPVRITSHGRVKAIIVSPSFFERAIEALEDIEDAQAFDEAIKDRSPGVPWEEVKKELGL